MDRIPKATPITFSGEERFDLDGLARSTRRVYRLRRRAQIVPLAAGGLCALDRAVDRAGAGQSVWRFLRAQRIDLAGGKSWCQSQDPAFAAKAAEIVGLYLNPPDGALVVAIDEKPHIQALENAYGYLKLPNGRALTGWSHDYIRHGTYTLFAALDVAKGEVMARHYKRRRDRVSRLHEPDCRRPSRPRNPCRARQYQRPHAQTRALACPPQERSFPFNADPRFLAQPDGMLVLHQLIGALAS
jgi:hypothetical protein